MRSLRFPGAQLRATVAVAALALGLFAAPASVLCLGADGHVALETSLAGCCLDGPADSPAAQRSTFDLAAADPCTDCTDVAVALAATRAPRHPGVPAIAASPVAATAGADPTTARPAADLSPRPPQRDRDLAVLRTTVLLI